MLWNWLWKIKSAATSLSSCFTTLYSRKKCSAAELVSVNCGTTTSQRLPVNQTPGKTWPKSSSGENLQQIAEKLLKETLKKLKTGTICCPSVFSFLSRRYSRMYLIKHHRFCVLEPKQEPRCFAQTLRSSGPWLLGLGVSSKTYIIWIYFCSKNSWNLPRNLLLILPSDIFQGNILDKR